MKGAGRGAGGVSKCVGKWLQENLIGTRIKESLDLVRQCNNVSDLLHLRFRLVSDVVRHERIRPARTPPSVVHSGSGCPSCTCPPRSSSSQLPSAFSSSGRCGSAPVAQVEMRHPQRGGLFNPFTFGLQVSSSGPSSFFAASLEETRPPLVEHLDGGLLGLLVPFVPDTLNGVQDHLSDRRSHHKQILHGENTHADSLRVPGQRLDSDQEPRDRCWGSRRGSE